MVRRFGNSLVLPVGMFLVIRFNLAHRRRQERTGLRLRVVMAVHPDHFHTRFFESLLTTGTGRRDRDIREALEATRHSAFELYRREIPLT